MVKRFSLNKIYGLMLVRTGEDGEPYTWTVRARYAGRDKTSRFFFSNEYSYRVSGNKVEIRCRFDDDEVEPTHVGPANIVIGSLVCY